MKVMCINGLRQGGISITTGNPASKCDEIYEGAVYTVYQKLNYKGQDYYILNERPITSGYNTKRFAPLSEIDETELAKEREELQTV